jgi:hypothetical protein
VPQTVNAFNTLTVAHSELEARSSWNYRQRSRDNKQSPQYLGYSCRCHDLAMGGFRVVRLLRPAAGPCVDSEFDVSTLPVACDRCFIRGHPIRIP